MAESLKSLSLDEFDEKIINFKKELFELRVKKARGEQIPTHTIKLTKSKIAKLSFYRSLKVKHENN